MALIINKDNLFITNGGTPLPDTGVLCRFKFFTKFRGFNLPTEIKYWKSSDSELNEWDTINITYLKKERDSDGNEITTRVQLPSSFELEIDLQQIGQIEQLLPSGIDIFSKILYAIHFLIKIELEAILGPNTVEIDLNKVG